MITHYDIKMETQRLRAVLSNEGVNIPPLLQVIRPGAYFHERRSLNNFHRDRVITFEQIAE